jgi:hypothetical protein
MIEVSLLENIDLHHIDNLLEKIDSKGWQCQRKVL